MNYEEAHKYIEDLQRELTMHRQAYSNELITANGLSILALEKQIRKKVIEDCICPNCGADVTNQADNDYLFEHCYHCGQALYWGDKNDL